MKKILIVDDQPDVRLMIRLALRDRFDLEEAGNAQAAYELVLAQPPDGIVLDVMLPGTMNGMDLCKKIRSNPKLPHMHIVLITARGQLTDRARGLSSGADAFFAKPFSPFALGLHLSDALLAKSTQPADGL